MNDQHDSIWRDEVGLPIHMHVRPRSCGQGYIGLQTESPRACSCGNPLWNISLSAAELIKKHEDQSSQG